MDIKLPKLGEGAESGVVVNIFVKAGDRVEKGQSVIELENEKAVASIPSTASGTVSKIYVKEGDKLSVGQRILSLTEEKEGAAAKSEAAPKPVAPEKSRAEKPAAPAEEEIENSNPVAGPAVRKLAQELGIDLKRVRGSEGGGRICVADLRAHVERLQKLAAQPKTGGAHGVTRPTTGVEPIDFSKWGAVTRKPMTQLRQVIARRMSESWNTIPHVTQFDEADFTRLNELRKKFTAAYEQKGVKLTLTPLILKALVETLKKHPMFNSSLDETANGIVFKEYFHLGIAVDTEQGLLVPVLRDVDKKSALDLAKELEQLAQKARDRKVSADEMRGGSFTISNQGAIGGAHFTPIVNKPEVAILGIGRGAMKPVARDGKVEVRMMTPLALSYDHRVIDGGAAARFIVDLVAALQNFDEAMLKS